MIEKLDLMKCGKCGGEDHKLFLSGKKIIVECNGCKNLSSIEVSNPKLEINWVDGNEGILAVF